MKKILSLLLALAMVLSLAACGGGGNPNSTGGGDNQESDAGAPEDTGGADEGEDAADAGDLPGFPLTYNEDAIYEMAFGEFYEYYTEARAESDMDLRYAKMAIAEAKLLESGVLIPGRALGGTYAMQRLATHSVPTVAWGSDGYRMHQYVVVDRDKILLASEIREINSNWADLCGTGTFHTWVKDYLTGKGYTLQDTYNGNYNGDPTNWDVLANSDSSNTQVLCNTYDGLMTYDVENVQQPGLATGYDISADGLTYTFHLREGVKWVDSQGREYATVKADDFVAGMQHLLDAKGGLEWLVEGVILNASEYLNGEVTDFGQVGVKAVDDLTVEYTLCEPTAYFPTMLSYGVFAPLCRVYYESQGGKFGADFDKTAADYNYAKGPDSIVYCGPFLITSFTAKNSLVFQQNPTYWNIDNCDIKTITWTYNDNTDVTRNYYDFLNGKIDSTSLGTSTVELAKTEGYFDDYCRIGGLDSMRYYSNFNLNRRAYANFNDDTVMVSPQDHGSVDEILNGAETSDIVDSAARTHAAVNNRHFRLAIAFAFDRGAHLAQTLGEEMKYVSLANIFVPGNYVILANEVTVDINGTPTTFPVGTNYGEMVQAQLTADGFPAKVWDESIGADDATTGFDGWFNLDNARAEFDLAVAELAAQGVEISAENPIYLDLPHAGMETSLVNQAEVYRQSMENAFGGAVKVNLITGNSWDDVDNATYWPTTGEEYNDDITALNFGWGGDWGDPNSYLDNFLPTGTQIVAFGLFG